MPTLILSAADVRRALDVASCIEAVAAALEDLARGRAENPLRVPTRIGGERILGWMPGALPRAPALGFKAVHVVPSNEGTPYDQHQGVVVLFEPEHGLPEAILDASAITALRTAATSALATRALARPESRALALLGSGVQAEAHLEALLCVRAFRDVRVYSRDPARRRAFAERARARTGLAVEPLDSVQAALEGADVVCTTTSAKEPILRADWLAPGAHVNAVGACTPRARELDSETVRRARVFVDRRESAAHEAGDLLLALEEGAIGPDHVAGELGEVLIGAVPGRTSSGQLTLFESLGLAVEDLAAARLAVERARALGLGIRADLGGRR